MREAASKLGVKVREDAEVRDENDEVMDFIILEKEFGYVIDDSFPLSKYLRLLKALPRYKDLMDREFERAKNSG